MDKETVVIKGYRHTRQKLNVISALSAKTVQDYLETLVDEMYSKAIEKANE